METLPLGLEAPPARCEHVSEMPHNAGTRCSLNAGHTDRHEYAEAKPAIPGGSQAAFLAMLEDMDVESVGDTLAGAMAECAKLAREMVPHQLVADLCRQALFRKMKARHARTLNHPEIDIDIKIRRQTVKDENALKALLDLKIDGRPIPEARLKKAVWWEDVPASREFHSDKTQVKTLVRDFGDPVKAIYDRAYVEVETEYLDIKPKEKPDA